MILLMLNDVFCASVAWGDMPQRFAPQAQGVSTVSQLALLRRFQSDAYAPSCPIEHAKFDRSGNMDDRFHFRSCNPSTEAQSETARQPKPTCPALPSSTELKKPWRSKSFFRLQKSDDRRPITTAEDTLHGIDVGNRCAVCPQAGP